MTNKWFDYCTKAKGPKYLAIANAIKNGVRQGLLQPGDKLPTHRALADELGITVGTVTRGYAEAEQQALIESKIGSGTFIKQAEMGMDFGSFEGQPESVIDLSYSFCLEQNQAHDLSESLAELAADQQVLQQLLHYHPVTGLPSHQAAAHQWLSMTGIHIDAKRNIILTNGGQHGFYSTVLGLCRSGDTVVAAGLTYPGFIAVTRQLGLSIEGAPFDEHGVLPGAFAEICERSLPKLFYVCTRINNPSCEVMTTERIDAIATIARRYGVWIVEDDVQGCLQGQANSTFAERHPDISILVSSTSKALAGGLRVGFVLPPRDLFAVISNAVKSSCWMASPLCAEVVSRWINQGRAERLINSQRKALQRRHQLTREILNGLTFNSVDTALNVWLYLPEHRRAGEFAEALEKRNVLVRASSGFATGHFAVPQAIRFCMGGSNSDEQLKQALGIIRQEWLSHPAEVVFSH